MASEVSSMNLRAIGIVRNDVKQAPGPGYDWWRVVSEIVVDNSLTEALDGLDEFSHIIVLCWLHQSRRDQLSAKVHPRGKLELPLVGFFATRSPNRPNPIGKATVRLLERQSNVLRVQGLDAINGTPVIDIKPYIPGNDSVTNAKVPPWIARR